MLQSTFRPQCEPGLPHVGSSPTCIIKKVDIIAKHLLHSSVDVQSTISHTSKGINNNKGNNDDNKKFIDDDNDDTSILSSSFTSLYVNDTYDLEKTSHQFSCMPCHIQWLGMTYSLSYHATTFTMSSPMTMVREESMVVDTSVHLKSTDTRGSSQTANMPCGSNSDDE